jgi:YopX protein/Resolvase, N terminal domain
MNREIKFRAWHKQVKALKPVEWINLKGDLLKVPFYGNWAKSSCVLMQYTGLKDKNGKEIYEGDIVKWLINLETTKYIQGCIPRSSVGHRPYSRTFGGGKPCCQLTMLIGYARVSTHEQTLNLQRDALEKAGARNSSLILPVALR